MHDLERDKIFHHKLFWQLLNADNAWSGGYEVSTLECATIFNMFKQVAADENIVICKHTHH